MDLDKTIIDSPNWIGPTHKAWTGTLREVIRWHSDQVTEESGLPMVDSGQPWEEMGEEGPILEPDWENFTIEHWREVLDDPNAQLAPAAVLDLRERVTAVADAEGGLADARDQLDETIRAAIDGGMSAYRVAQITGLTQATVAKSRGRAQRARGVPGAWSA